MWTWFPFGRIARDVSSLAATPEMVLEKTMGIPVHALGEAARAPVAANPFVPGGLLKGMFDYTPRPFEPPRKKSPLT